MLGPYIIISQLLYLAPALLLWFRGYRTTQRCDEQECMINMRINIFGTQVLDIVVFTLFSLTYQTCTLAELCLYDPTLLFFGLRFLSFLLFTTLSSGIIMDQPIMNSGLLHDLYRLAMIVLTLGLMAVDPDTVALPILAILSCICILAVHHIIIFAATPCGKPITALERRKIKCLAIAVAFLSIGFVMFMFSRKALVEDAIFQGLILSYTVCFSVGIWFWAWSMNVEEVELSHIKQDDDALEFDSAIENRKFRKNKAEASFRSTQHHVREISDDEDSTPHSGDVSL